ncbi:hypothetical protein LINPERHAP2_LOCUS16800 [Linum perenne]
MITNELYWRVPGNLGNTTAFHVFVRKVLNQGRTLSHIHSFGFVFRVYHWSSSQRNFFVGLVIKLASLFGSILSHFL